MILKHKTVLNFSHEAVSKWFFQPGAFARLVPPFQNIEVDPSMEPVREGSLNTFKVKDKGFSIEWKARHSEVKERSSFIDTQEEGPFSKWVHLHQILPDPENSARTVLLDEVQWEGPFLTMATFFSKGFVNGLLTQNFRFREVRLNNDLLRHEKFKDQPRLKIGITGSTGVIGTALSAFLLTGGHDVYRFVRRKATHPNEIFWDPQSGQIESDKVQPLDVVIHLAGENLAKQRWTEDFKRKVLESRTQGTALISKTLDGFKDRKRKLISASAIGYYGDTGSSLVDESSASGSGFLAHICKNWESSLEQVSSEYLKVHVVRIGVVLTQRGGALKELSLPTKMGVAGPMGTGEQYMSWISLDDAIYSLYEIIMGNFSTRVFNLVSENPLPQAKLIGALAKKLKRPAIMKMPKIAVKVLLGEMGEEVLLQGQRVEPRSLIKLGYKFTHPNIEDVLNFEFGPY